MKSVKMCNSHTDLWFSLILFDSLWFSLTLFDFLWFSLIFLYSFWFFEIDSFDSFEPFDWFFDLLTLWSFELIIWSFDLSYEFVLCSSDTWSFDPMIFWSFELILFELILLIHWLDHLNWSFDLSPMQSCYLIIRIKF